MVHRKFRKYRSVQNKNYDNLMTFSLENEDVWYPDYFLIYVTIYGILIEMQQSLHSGNSENHNRLRI